MAGRSPRPSASAETVDLAKHFFPEFATAARIRPFPLAVARSTGARENGGRAQAPELTRQMVVQGGRHQRPPALLGLAYPRRSRFALAVRSAAFSGGPNTASPIVSKSTKSRAGRECRIRTGSHSCTKYTLKLLICNLRYQRLFREHTLDRPSGRNEARVALFDGFVEKGLVAPRRRALRRRCRQAAASKSSSRGVDDRRRDRHEVARCLFNVVMMPRISPARSSCETTTMRMAPLVSDTRWMNIDEAGM